MKKRVLFAVCVIALSTTSCSFFEKNPKQLPENPTLPSIIDPLEPSVVNGSGVSSSSSLSGSISGTNLTTNQSESSQNIDWTVLESPETLWVPSSPEAHQTAATGTVDDTEVKAAMEEIDRLFNGLAEE